MNDYIVLRNINGNTNLDFYDSGKTIYALYVGAWRAGYTSSDSSLSVRVGVWRTSNRYTFVFAANKLVTSLDLRIVSPYIDNVRNITSITTQFAGGYYTSLTIALDEPTINYTVFLSESAVLEAIAFESIPTQGLCVVATANPVPIGINGLVVRATATLLDPNDQGGTSEPGGGDGGFDDTSDTIPIQPLPSISAADGGLITIFQPSLTELRDLGDYLWTHLTDFVDNLNKLFSNPMDFIISLHILPVIPATGTVRNIYIGKWLSDISMKPLLSQWIEVDCGTVVIPQYWGSALDYSPNTRISAMLPFIGSVTLNTDEVMGNAIGLVYHIDALSGNCVAMITVNGSVLYQFTGDCAIAVPLTGADWSRLYAAAVGAIGAVAIGASMGSVAGHTSDFNNALVTSEAASQGAKAVAAGAKAFSSLSYTSKGVPGVAGMRAQLAEANQAVLDAGNALSSAAPAIARGMAATQIARTVNNVASNVMSGKMQIQHSGSISGTAGMLGNKVPYVTIEYPNQSLAQNYKHYVGYPCNMTKRLGELSGYTECEQFVCDGIPGTDGEIAELIQALKGGVYL